jgi:hypothetical protein
MPSLTTGAVFISILRLDGIREKPSETMLQEHGEGGFRQCHLRIVTSCGRISRKTRCTSRPLGLANQKTESNCPHADLPGASEASGVARVAPRTPPLCLTDEVERKHKPDGYSTRNTTNDGHVPFAFPHKTWVMHMQKLRLRWLPLM